LSDLQQYRLSPHERVVEEADDDLEAFLHACLGARIDDEHKAVDVCVIVVPDAADVGAAAQVIENNVVTVERKLDAGIADRWRDVACDSCTKTNAQVYYSVQYTTSRKKFWRYLLK